MLLWERSKKYGSKGRYQNCTFEDFGDDVSYGSDSVLNKVEAPELAKEISENAATGFNADPPVPLAQGLLFPHKRPAHTKEFKDYPDVVGPFGKFFVPSGGKPNAILTETYLNDFGLFIRDNFDQFRLSPEFLGLYWLYYENTVRIQYKKLSLVSLYGLSGQVKWKDFQINMTSPKLTNLQAGTYFYRQAGNVHNDGA